MTDTPSTPRPDLGGLKLCRVVTLASATGRYGGPYDTARRQARLAAMMGADVTLFAAYIDGDEPSEDATHGLTYALVLARRYFMKDRFSTLFSVKVVTNLWSQIGDADVVHVSFARETVPITAALLCLIRRKRWIAQTHGMMTVRYSLVHRVADLIALPLLRRATKIMALTSNEMTAIKRLPRMASASMVALGNPLPEYMPERSCATSREAVFIARLHPRKRVLDFVAAAQHAAKKSWPEFYTVIGPDWGDLDKVQSAAREVCNLSYGGAVSSREVMNRLRDAAVFVMCSDDEPWGNVLASALAIGVPVVVTESAALADEVRRAGAGLVVDSRSPQEIAHAVHTIVSDPDMAERMSRCGRTFAAATLSNDSQMTAIAKLYAQVADT